MAIAQGFVCDVCHHFEYLPQGQDAKLATAMPEGWMHLQVYSPGDVRAGVKHVCSNKCLLNFAKLRVAADRGDRSTKQPKQSRPLVEYLQSQGVETASIGSTIANHVRHHTNQDVVELNCLACKWELDQPPTNQPTEGAING